MIISTSSIYLLSLINTNNNEVNCQRNSFETYASGRIKKPEGTDVYFYYPDYIYETDSDGV